MLDWIFPVRMAVCNISCIGFCPHATEEGSDNTVFFRGPQPPNLLGVVDPPLPPLPTIEEGYASCRVALTLRTWQ